MSSARVSIVIPTKNGEKTLPAVLHAIWQQRFTGGIEVVAVDSGSTDGTVDLLKDRVDRLITIPPESFNHGLTRNLGIEATTGELVVMLVQDAVPQSENWLNALIAPFRVSSQVAGTFARQVPRDDASPLSRRYHRLWVAAGTSPFESSLENEAEFDRFTPAERHLRCAFDNVCSCIRRDVWRTHPFVETPIAEDLEWAKTVLLTGHRIAFAPDAVVVHSHDRQVGYEFHRTREAHERLNALFGLQTIPTLPHLARAIVSSAFAHTWTELGAPERLPRALALAVAWPLGQYLGARRSEAARPAPAGLGITG
jgi:rhamnosyltransferase